jgi:TRAP-type C4-dicarboxylate transport system substrate-binding protein
MRPALNLQDASDMPAPHKRVIRVQKQPPGGGRGVATVDFANRMNSIRPTNRHRNARKEETPMTITRRRILAATAAAPLAAPWIAGTARAEARQLKISHQFPGGTIDSGDFRDQLCRRFAADLAKRTNGALTAEVYPNSSLVKTVAQYSAIRRGALDMTLYPLNYAGGEVPEYNIGFMPGVISSYAQAYAWKKAAIGKRLSALMAEKGAICVTWLWQAGGTACRETKPILVPEDVKGKKVRGGSREMDLMLKGAGASVVSMPSNELYAAMQTGTMDVAMTSSTSLISFRLEEIAKSLTTGRNKGFFFIFEPLLMSKQIFDSLPKDQQTAIMDIGAEMEKFGMEKAKGDDEEVVKVYAKRDIKAYDIDQAQADKWKAVARDTCWKDYADKSASNAEFLKLSQEVPSA